MATKQHRTEIIVAIIGLVGVLGAALVANWDKIFDESSSTAAENDNQVYSPSRTCKYTEGPKKGLIQYFSPKEFPRITPASVGQYCTDGLGSTGIAVRDRPDA